MNSPTLGEQLIRALVGFPKYIVGWLGGLLWTVLSVYDATSVVILATLVGIALTSVLYGAITFFVVWITIRAIGNLADAIVASARIASPNNITNVNYPEAASIQVGTTVREG